MATYKALKSFSGIISMKKGDEREIKDEDVAKDLLRAGFVIGLESEEKPSEEKPKASSSKKASKAKADKDGES